MDQHTQTHQALFPIRVVSVETGVKPVTLRAWEQRYGLIEPQRSQSGHRLYSMENIQTVHAILGLLDRGIPISRVKSLLNDAPLPEKTPTSHTWLALHQTMVDAAEKASIRGLTASYQQATTQYGKDNVIRHLMIPLLKSLEIDPDKQSQRYVFESFVQQCLQARLIEQQAKGEGPKVWVLGGHHRAIPCLLISSLLYDLGLQAYWADSPSPEHLCHTLNYDALLLGMAQWQKHPGLFKDKPVFSWVSQPNIGAFTELGGVPLDPDPVQSAQNIADVLTLA